MALPASYATVGDVLSRYPPIGSVSAISSSQVALAIGATQARIDSVLSQRYAVPFSPLPPVIEMIAGDLACLRLVETRILVMTQQGQTTKVMMWTQQLQASADLLASLASGKTPLITGSGTVMGQTATGAGEVWSSTMSNTPTFIGQDWADVQEPDSTYFP